MASADKTYVNKEQYKLIKIWWLKTRKKQKRELGHEIYMYPFQYLDVGDDSPAFDPAESDLDIELFGDGESTLWNTPTRANLWILKNCPFDFIQEQIKEKLTDFWYSEIPKKQQALGIIGLLDFRHKDRITYIKSKDVNIYFFKNLKDGRAEVIDKVIVYGTTNYLKVISEALTCIEKYEKKYEINFIYCGINFKLKNGKLECLELKQKDIFIPYLRTSNFKLPKVKQSFSIKDSEKYSREEIILSNEKEVFGLFDFKADVTLDEALFQSVPKYILTTFPEFKIKNYNG